MNLYRLITATALSLLAASGSPAQNSADDEAAGRAWWHHVQVLADPAMKGRLTGSEEYLRAAAYVVEQFKKDGLEPAGVDGTFYQPVHFEVQRVIAEQSSLALTAGASA